MHPLWWCRACHSRPCLTHFPSLLTESNFVAGDVTGDALISRKVGPSTRSWGKSQLVWVPLGNLTSICWMFTLPAPPAARVAVWPSQAEENSAEACREGKGFCPGLYLLPLWREGTMLGTQAAPSAMGRNKGQKEKPDLLVTLAWALESLASRRVYVWEREWERENVCFGAEKFWPKFRQQFGSNSWKKCRSVSSHTIWTIHGKANT